MTRAFSPRVAGNGVSHPVGATPAGTVEGDLRLQVTVVLRPRNPHAHERASPVHPSTMDVLTVDDLARRYDPGNDRVNLVRRYARAQGLSVLEVSRARHDMVLEGTVEQFSRAMAVTLQWWEHAGRTYRAHDEPIRLSQELRAAVEGVLGLDDVPVHRAYARAATPAAFVGIPTLERQYGFPQVDASKERIALLEFAGGFSDDDIAAYARRIGLTKLPQLTAVPVRSSTGQLVQNTPLDRGRAAAIAADWKASVSFADLAKAHGAADLEAFVSSMEVTMDIQLALALGGGAAVDVYFAPSGVDGWRRALYASIGLPVGGAVATQPPKPTVFSVSWGESESVFGPAQLRAIDRTLIAVQHAGVGLCCSSGDWGSVNSSIKPGAPPARPNVNFPASSPSALACGGTRLLDGDTDRRREVAWDERVLQTTMATGGGMSGFFPRPTFQRHLRLHAAKGTWRAPGRARAAGRSIPDIAANAAWSSAPEVVFAGHSLGGFGTSAAAPICAALLTRVSASVGHSVAGIARWLYTEAGRECCRAVIRGDNDITRGAVPFYHAGPGWNACTGLGTLDGDHLVSALESTRPLAERARR